MFRSRGQGGSDRSSLWMMMNVCARLYVRRFCVVRVKQLTLSSKFISCILDTCCTSRKETMWCVMSADMQRCSTPDLFVCGHFHVDVDISIACASAGEVCGLRL